MRPQGTWAMNQRSEVREPCAALEGAEGQGLAYPPVIIHNGDEQADLIHVLWGNVKDDGLIVDGVERVLLYGGLLLLQPAPVTKQRHFDVWICADGKGRERMKQMSSNVISSRGTEALELLLLVGLLK